MEQRDLLVTADAKIGMTAFCQMLAGYPDVMSSAQAAQALGTNAITLRKLIGEGKLRAVRLGRVWRISKTAILEFLGEEA